MPQTLYIREGKGEAARQRKVTVLRSWQSADGRALYLHANGIYGYKDGTPIKDIRELSIIMDKPSRARAELWWKIKGRKISQAFYDAEAVRLEELASRGVPDLVEGDSTPLDELMYIRRPLNKRLRSDFSDPFTWMEVFETRPDWWGGASMIDINGYRYERVDDPGQEEAPPGDPDPDDPGASLDPDDAGGSEPETTAGEL